MNGRYCMKLIRNLYRYDSASSELGSVETLPTDAGLLNADPEDNDVGGVRTEGCNPLPVPATS